MLASSSALLLGCLLGVRHAFEPDHLAAVSSLVVESRSAARGALLGAIWGVGHTISLLVLGTILIVTGTVLPVRAAAGFELAVAIMLVVLGVRSIIRALRQPVRDAHAHPHRRPLVVGVVHGLAGTGAITALVFAQLPTIAARVVYIALFGLGSVAGMALATGVAGAGMARLARPTGGRDWLGLAAGVTAVGLGVAWGVAV